ncbi:MAG: thrombospondin type 3 repeat-containing protein [Chitinophagaceae bacterium]
MNLKRLTSLYATILLASIFTCTYAQNGVPKRNDADGDGVKDKKDKCPSTPAGVAVDGFGCPVDTDKDGVADYLDKCPTVPGTKEMNGCQDKDKDGVSDYDDACPDVPGLPRFKGCPDSDGDGIEDANDKCPNQKGLDMFHGCPDTDGDGIEDANDKCPNTPKGVKVDATGCPADSDKDGVIDSDDKCPNTKPGVKVDAKGCPADTDGDGVIDSEDNCPTVMGDASNHGCPVIKEIPKAVPKRLEFAPRTINYESGIAALKAGSYPMLDEVANLAKDYPDYTLRITAHTDAVEKMPGTVSTRKKPVPNTPLSESRLDAVKSYLLGKGVPESRMETMAYGSDKPVGSNKTISGRGQNRRVVLEFFLR